MTWAMKMTLLTNLKVYLIQKIILVKIQILFLEIKIIQNFKDEKLNINVSLVDATSGQLALNVPGIYCNPNHIICLGDSNESLKAIYDVLFMLTITERKTKFQQLRSFSFFVPPTADMRRYKTHL